MNNYVPLHVHDHYSLLDGGATPAEYMARCKELGITHLSQTNHGTTSGFREFQREADKAGIVPILGIEGYIAEDPYDRRSKAKRQDGTQVYAHQTVLAKSGEGIKTINRHNKFGWTEGFYSKPRWGKDMLLNDSSDLIVLSGCMSGLIPKALLNGDAAKAYEIAQQYRDALGDDFYIEVMATNAAPLNHALLKLADDLGIKAAMTSDCHYARKEELPMEEALLILSSSPQVDFSFDMSKAKKMDWLDRFNYLYPERVMSFQEIEVYLRSRQEEEALFAAQEIDRTDIFENTWDIASKIGEYPYHEGLDMLPQPKVDGKAKLRELAYKGLAERNLDTQEYRDRIEEELKIVFDKNFEVYFLIMYKMAAWAREEGIRTGFGRGSSSAFLLNYTLYLTHVDPIKYNIPPFRFLDPTRPDWPDLDWDVEDSRREEVKDKFRETFTSVAGISTISYFQGKSSIRDAARVFRIPLSEVDRALKNNDASMAMNESFEYYDWFVSTTKGREFNNKHPEVVELAKMLYGKIRSMGQHPSAIVASRKPIEEYAPVQSAKKPGTTSSERVEVIGLDMHEVEDSGFIKFDILGLKALSVVGQTVDLIKERHGKDIDIYNLPLDDSRVYAEVSKGYTKGVFQLEQPAYTGLILDMGGVQNFDQLMASNALVRPGAMKSIGPSYIARKNGKEVVEYIHPKTEYFTQNTYGLPTLYQESQMLLCVELGGMTMAEANQVRRGLGKKQIDKILPFKEKFIKSATEYIGAAKATKLWDDLEFGAEYNFNIPHSAAYSMLSYVTAWLKYYYPTEFMTATITNEKDDNSVTDYLIEARRLGVSIKLPHVNKSGLYAKPEGRRGIRLGLRNVKYCGEKAAQGIVLNGPYTSYEHFVEVATTKGSGINKRVRDNLNLIGAAYFPDNPRRGDEKDHLYEVLKIPSFVQAELDPRVAHQLSATDEYNEEDVHLVRGMLRSIQRQDTWARVDILDEVGNISAFIDPNTTVETGKIYLFLIAANSVIRVVDIEDLNAESNDPFVAFLYGRMPELQEEEYASIAFKPRKTKAGKNMATVVAKDHLGELHAILVWPSDFDTAKGQLMAGRKWKGQVKEKDEDGKITKFFAPPKGRFAYATARGAY